MTKPPLLTHGETMELIRQAQAGDLGARNKLIEHNMGLIKQIVKSYSRCGLDFDDLAHEGIFGLVAAIKNFDPGFGAMFSTYAKPWIADAINTAILNTGGPVRLSERLARWIKDAKDGWVPDTKERAMLVRQGMLLRSMATTGNFDSMVRRDRPHFREELYDLAAVLKGLPTRELAVIRRRYGLGGQDEETLREIAEDLCITKERVRQLETRALARMRARYEGRAAV